jgi:uncharacterized protein (TIGR02996 family)
MCVSTGDPLAFLRAIMADPEEAFLYRAVVANPQGDAPRQAYAEWLTARGDPRGELLSLELVLSQETPVPPNAPALRARYAELREGIDALWLGAMRRAPSLMNCGAAPSESPRVRFAFECPNQWEELAPTATEGVRHCAQCDQAVYRCATQEAAEEHALAGHCIAVETRLAGAMHATLTKHIVGRPSMRGLWARRIFGDGE